MFPIVESVPGPAKPHLPDARRVGVGVLPARQGQRSARAAEDDRLLARIREAHAAN